MERNGCSSAASTPQTINKDLVDIATTRLMCRGMKLLGMEISSTSPRPTPYVCVHQLSVKLWNRYDTPRAAVQKKLESLKCKVEFCTKEQIHKLREKGIIENHRATIISLQDAELLCDALEASRRKRGLEKHKLKTNDRNMRKEEVKIRKRALQRDLRRGSNAAIREGALNRDRLQQAGGGDQADNSLQEDTTLDFYPDDFDLPYSKHAGTLLVTEEGIELPGDADWEFTITRAPNPAFFATLPATQLMDESTVPTEPSENEPLNSYMQSGSGASDYTLLESCSSNLHIHSPSLALTSDTEDRASHHSLSTSSTRSHSNTTTPTKSSPERFLFMESDCESDNQGSTICNNTALATPQTALYRSRVIPHKGKQIREFAEPCRASGKTARRSSDSGAMKVFTEDAYNPPQSSKHRSVTATKLLHYAKTTSPSAMTSVSGATPQRTDSLIVSIPLTSLASSSKISSTKPRVLTPLSKFATKKRALSRSPSLSSNYDNASSPTSSGTTGTLTSGIVGVQGKATSLPSSKGNAKVGRPPKKSKVKAKTPAHTECSPIPTEPSPFTTDAVAALEGNKVDGSDHQELLPEDHCGLELPPNNIVTTATEDDVISITSTTTSSTNSTALPKTVQSWQQKQSKGGKRGSRGSQSSRGSQGNSSNNNLLRIDSNFSLESLFSCCPPTLTIRNGELVPEKSLSIKNVDRSSLPSSHPIHNWSLGQPVKNRWVAGTNGSVHVHRQRKPRKNSARPSNSNDNT